MDRSILLLGGTGQVGHELRRTLAPLGTVQAPGRGTIDLMDPESVRRAVMDLEPEVVVNAAAYNDVDEAENEPETAAIINARAPRALADVTRELGAWLVHYTSDYVFDGTKTTPYREDDPTNPINVYGRTKREGEEAIQDVGGRFLILRTSWIYSDRRSNFLRTMLKLTEDNDSLSVVDDQTGTPTWAGWVAEATAIVLRQILETEDPDRYRGLYHLAASGQTSRYGFARAIFARFGYENVTVEPISSEEYPTVADRPAYSVLSSERIRSTFALPIPTWTEQLAAMQRRMEGETALDARPS